MRLPLRSSGLLGCLIDLSAFGNTTWSWRRRPWYTPSWPSLKVQEPMADSWQTRIWEGWWSVRVCSLVVVESDSWCADPTALWTGDAFWPRIIGMLLALSASCLFPLRLHASLPRTYECFCSLMSVSCLGLRPPAAMVQHLWSVQQQRRKSL